MTIYERYDDIRLVSPPAGRSINLVLTKRGLRLAQRMNLASELTSIAVEVKGRAVHQLTGPSLTQAYGRRGECNYSVDRTALNKFWLMRAEKEGCQFQFDHTLNCVQINRGGVLEFLRSDKTRVVVDVNQFHFVLACDGGGSVMRQCLSEAGLVKSSESLLETGYKEVSFPAKVDGSYVLDPHSLHIWPRTEHLLMALANGDGSFTGTIYMDDFESVCKSEKSAREFLRAHYSSALSLVNEEAAIENLLDFKEGRLGTVRCEPWLAELDRIPVLLLGDAAHAIVPFFGQGVNCGFEDVLKLDELLDLTDGCLGTAMKGFEAIRKRDTDAIADLALENFEEMRSKVGNSEFQFLKKIDAFLMDYFPKIYRTRYTLVMYSSNSYFACKQFGEIQKDFLSILVREFHLTEKSNLEVCLEKEQVQRLIETHISPAVVELGICLDF